MLKLRLVSRGAQTGLENRRPLQAACLGQPSQHELRPL